MTLRSLACTKLYDSRNISLCWLFGLFLCKPLWDHSQHLGLRRLCKDQAVENAVGSLIRYSSWLVNILARLFSEKSEGIAVALWSLVLCKK